MEDFFQRLHGPIGQRSVRLYKEAAHLPLPTFIHFALGHPSPSAFEVIGFKIADQKAIASQEQ
jgi:hypothetical protein